MLTAEITSIPASSISSTSCQRFSLREPGTLVCANSSTRAISGRRASTASTSISSKVRAAVLQLGPGDGFQAVEQRDGLRARVRLGEPHHDVGAALGTAVPLAEHGVGLAHPGRGSQVNPQMTTPRPGSRGAGSAGSRGGGHRQPSPPGLPGSPRRRRLAGRYCQPCTARVLLRVPRQLLLAAADLHCEARPPGWEFRLPGGQARPNEIHAPRIRDPCAGARLAVQ